ncbi:MAG: glycosyltransferase family 4 protein [Planctomycetota bacterium]
MKVAVALESRFVRTPDGAVWSLGWLDHTFWQRYLAVFAGVNVIARIQNVEQPPGNGRRVDAEGVTFMDIPYYVGPWQLARRFRSVKRAIKDAVRPDDALVLRVPGQIGSFACDNAMRTGKPFGVEVIGDPAEVFSGGVRSVVAPLARRSATASLRRACAHGCAVAYVSMKPLAERYPPHSSAMVTTYSSIDLRDDAFVDAPRAVLDPPKPLRIITVGSLAQLYKAPDVLIKAVSKATRIVNARASDAPPFHLTIVGDGRHRVELESLARSENMAATVSFAGQIPSGDPVRAALDGADLFVLASRTEGLPRAMIEAMARGLPCLGTAVGGIPDLLASTELVPPDNVDSLAQALVAVAGDVERLRRLSSENIEKAKSYHADELAPRRRSLYEHLRVQTDTWQAQS